MPPHRILHLITGLSTGGAERTLLRLVSAMDRSSFDNSVISMTGDGDVGPLIRAEGIPVRCLGMRRGVPAPGALRRVVSILRRERPAILQTWLYHADLLGLIASRFARGPRLIWNIRCSEMDMSRYSLLSRTTRRLLAMASRMPDAVVVNSHAGLGAHERYGYSPRRWEVIPNGFDPNDFKRDEAGAASLRDELGIARDAPVIGTLARFDPMKDYGTFLEAASQVRRGHARLRIVMAGPGMEPGTLELQRMISAAGLKDAVTLLGTRDDVPRVLSALDVYCLSSLGEGFPNTLAEAMLCEVPVVVTAVGDAEWITGSKGVPPGQATAFAARVQSILDLGPAERRAIGGAHRERVKREFGMAAMVGMYESLYRRLAG